MFPTSSFVLSQPIPLAAAATSAAAVHVTATGALAIHGVAKTVSIPLDARLSSTRIEVAGSITFPWGDFGMEAPSIGGFVRVTDKATMEFDLFLTHS